MKPAEGALQPEPRVGVEVTRPSAPGDHSAGSLKAIDPAWAWASYEPSSKRPWGTALAAHLLRRAGYGPTWKEIQEAQSRGPQATIDALFRQPENYAAFESRFAGFESAAARSNEGTVFVAWWLRRLRESPWPLLEKLTLFWHGHFAIRPPVGADMRLTYAHLQKLRGQAFASFPSMIGAIADDPAMYAALGGDQNRKSRPNLHFARPWLEAFSIGPEETTPSEVTNLARAWTGWFLYGGKLRFIEREHDSGPQSLLGQEGNWGRDDAVRLLAEHPATARNLARRLLREFVSESAAPPDRLLAPLADKIGGKAPMSEVLEIILRSNLFFSEHAVGQRIKSPVDLAIGLLRSLEGGMPSSTLAEDLANLGQRLEAPPTVSGWPGGVNWINTISIAGRLRLCESLIRGSGAYGAGVDPGKVAAGNGLTTAKEDQTRFLMEVLLPLPIPAAVERDITDMADQGPGSLKRALEALVARPEFQLC